MTQLPASKLIKVLRAAGFTGDGLRKAWSASMKESGGDPKIVGGPNANGTYDYGLFQINEIHKKNLKWDKILKAKYQAKVAYRWTKAGDDWSTWGIGENGWAGQLKKSNPAAWKDTNDRFNAYYKQFPDVLKLVDNPRAVYFDDIKPGLRNESVFRYQTAMRVFAPGRAAKVAPSGATGYYGNETRALTKKMYVAAKKRGKKITVPSNVEYPTKELVQLLGLELA
jgi:hypothetical protein